MDFSTVKNKLENGKYSSAKDFEKDVKLIWTNCMLFNSDDSDLFKVAVRSNKAFEKVMKQLYKTGSIIKKRKSANTPIIQRKQAVSCQQKEELCLLLSKLNEIQLHAIVTKLEKYCPQCVERTWKNGETGYGKQKAKVQLDVIDADTFSKLEDSLKKVLET